MTKEELQESFTEMLNDLPDNRDLELEYMSINVKVIEYDGREDTYYVGNNFRVDYKAGFKCDMGYQQCQQRGYCNGDC